MTFISKKVRNGHAVKAALLTTISTLAATSALGSDYEIDEIAVFNTVNIEDRLNTLPQFIPSFDSSSNNPGDGSARLNLRGLGNERTLILIDGRRLAPFSGDAIVDVNAIPASLIESVDILTGEGAVQYGSGAVAGVVNLKLKSGFEGIELAISDELSAADWDGNVLNASVLAGTGFADGRGHIQIGGVYTKRNGIEQGDRAFSEFVLFDPGPNGSEFIVGGSDNIPGVRFSGWGSSNFNIAPETIDPTCGASNANSCFGFWNAGGGGSAGDIRGFRFGGAGGQNDLYNYAPSNYLQIPQERFSVHAAASFEISDFAEAYMRGIFTHNDSETKLAPAPTGSIPVTVNIDNPAIPPALLSLILNDPGSYQGGPTANIRINKRLEEVGDRATMRDSEALNLTGGIRGDLSAEWSYDVFANYSRSDVDLLTTGGFSTSAIQAGVLCDTGPTATASGCTAPYIDIFGGAGGISQAGADFIARQFLQQHMSEVLQVGATLAGLLEGLKFPTAQTAPILSLGLEYRDESVDSASDATLSSQIRGFNTRPVDLSGSQDVTEIFGAMTLPLIQDVPFFHDITISGGGRWSDYSTAGDIWSYNAQGRWSPVSGLTFSAGYERGHRVPNIRELFGPQFTSFPGVLDPCSGLGFNPQVIIETCPVQTFQLFSQVQSISGGNPDLRPERSKVKTLSVEFAPEFAKGLVVSGGYFDIEITDAVSGAIPAQTILNACHLDGLIDFCSLIERDASGLLQSIRTGALNAASQRARGVDFGLDYRIDDLSFDGSDAGSLSFSYIATRMLESSFNVGFNAPEAECSGLYGAQCGEGEPEPKLKHSFMVTHEYGPVMTSMRWRRIGAVEVDQNDASFVSDLSSTIPSQNYVDISMTYNHDDQFDLTLGVRNILGEDTPILGSTVNEQANTWPATYETLGRQVFAGAKIRF